MPGSLTKEIAYNEFQKFFQDKQFVLFGTGMSCAVDNNFGMGVLEDKLKCQMGKEPLSGKQKDEWKGVLQSLKNAVDFETAMNKVTNEELINKIKDQNCNGIIITKETNKRIDKLLNEANNLWLVCQSKADTVIKNKRYSDSLVLENEELWKVDVFTRKILGE